jgi:hypothetical protein
VSMLLRLYPRSWRDRYGDEVAALLDERRQGPLDALDLLLGALDAHLRGRRGRIWHVRQDRTGPARPRLHPIVPGRVRRGAAAYACVTSLVALAVPDPERWVGSGPAGLAAGAGTLLAAIAGSTRWPAGATVVGLIGGFLAAVSAPWVAPFALLIGSMPILPTVVRRTR